MEEEVVDLSTDAIRVNLNTVANRDISLDNGVIDLTASPNEVVTSRKRRRRPASGPTSSSSSDGVVIVESKRGKVASGNVSLENVETGEEIKRNLKCSICLEKITLLTSTTCGHIYCK